MANLSPFEIVRRGREAIHQWRQEDTTETLDLSLAGLRGVDLSRADLSKADLRGANFGWTTLVRVDLSKAQGLKRASHEGPSAVGVDTLAKSAGYLPKAFLRGCGVPEGLINYLSALTIHTTEFCTCFISYSNADKSFARRLHDRLQDRGIRCWLNEHQLLPGDDVRKQLERGFDLWDKVLLVASEPSLKDSWWVDREISRAYQKEAKIMKERGKIVLALIPLDLDGYTIGVRRTKPDANAGIRTEVVAFVHRRAVLFERFDELGVNTFDHT